MANTDPIEGNLLAVCYGVKGAIISGDLPGITLEAPAPTPAVPTPQPPAPGVDPNMMPAHLRPSAPPATPGGQTPTQHREMTENERRLMRESGMTEDQWFDLMELPADKVAKYQFPKPAGK